MTERGDDGIAAPRVSVSVVLPCFRCTRTVRRAVTSVARQSVLPRELILIDDASGDSTLALLADLQREFGEHWLKVISLDSNCGPASARNTGWEAASGKYVAFLDDDDAWHPRKIEIQHAFMEAHADVEISGHDHRRLEEDDCLDTPLGRKGYRMISYGALLMSNPFITPSVMIRRDIPQRFQAGKRYMEDHLLWAEVASRGGRIAFINEVLAFTFKAPLGGSGLSARIWEMRKAELANYWALHGEGRLGLAATISLCAYSLAKHMIRSLMLVLHRTK
jgi:glycosyltransferase involved in cell wall biosynthesis